MNENYIKILFSGYKGLHIVIDGNLSKGSLNISNVSNMFLIFSLWLFKRLASLSLLEMFISKTQDKLVLVEGPDKAQFKKTPMMIGIKALCTMPRRVPGPCPGARAMEGPAVQHFCQ